MYRITKSLLWAALSLTLALAAFPVVAGAAETGSILSAQGGVQVNGSAAQAGTSVKTGDDVTTGADGQAVLQFFDGSQVTLKPGAEMTVNHLEKSAGGDKILKFKLMVGQLLAKVKKLASADSSFEIDAGGVVCGVRGTEFSMDFNSQGGHHLELHVLSGTVYARAGGQETLFNAGDTGRFTGGQLEGGEKPLSQDPALRDLKALFAKELLINHDNTFTDPAVGGTALIPTRANVPPGEAVP
jgi:hypothetical protein